MIAAVGTGLTAPAGATELDATGMIVAPGLVDTHWHLWNTLLRGMSEGGPGYFRLCRSLGPAFGAEDVYQGTLLGCAEAISSGITTVHDWCHNVRTPAHAEAGLRALAQAGLRARFSYGYPAAHRGDQAMDLAGLRRLHAEWAGRGADGLLSLGMAWRGPGGSDPAMRVPAAIYRPEIDTARELGIPVTVHACGPRARGRPDRHAGRRRPARPRPAGGARELGNRGRDRAARGGGRPGDHLAVERDPGRVRAAAHPRNCWPRASPWASRWTPRRSPATRTCSPS